MPRFGARVTLVTPRMAVSWVNVGRYVDHHLPFLHPTELTAGECVAD